MILGQMHTCDLCLESNKAVISGKSHKRDKIHREDLADPHLLPAESIAFATGKNIADASANDWFITFATQIVSVQKIKHSSTGVHLSCPGKNYLVPLGGQMWIHKLVPNTENN
ncbi:hypothetical protein AVEN_107401-1 [Araneus ventricosus]|uniref:Uncharacterized protein n=1 Tax=Araneus ventricosus TaxID=182803 RepID=A0A4Y2QII9_ARAVE|nr:hypothetical protein AVEN_107401-1 [Araneus ventricosus]